MHKNGYFLREISHFYEIFVILPSVNLLWIPTKYRYRKSDETRSKVLNGQNYLTWMSIQPHLNSKQKY